MNALKIEIYKKLEGAETSREMHSKLNNTRKIFNFPLSPRNKNVKSINLGNIKPLSKCDSKGYSSEKIIKTNNKNKKKQDSTHNFNHSNHNNNNLNNNINQIKNLDLKDNDIKEFKIMKMVNKHLLFQNEIANKKIKPILFPNNNINSNNNILIKTKKNIFNNFDNININLNNENKINKKDLSSIMDITNIPFFARIEPKKSSSYLKGKNVNKKIKHSKKSGGNLSQKFIDEEKINRIKTPTKKLFLQNERNKVKESLSEFINFDNNIDQLKNNLINDIQDKKKEKIYPEENHFKAVFYSQEIKRFNNNLE